MSDARWQRLQALFDALLEQPAATHEAWLATNEPDAALAAEALALVRAHLDDEDTDSLTARIGSAAGEALREPAKGLRLGPYVLLEEIGSGGMGTVFLAERVDAEFDHRVAIKIIRGIATNDASQRLRRERQILADLSHPNIARLLDGGTSEAGQPYLVMEYIDGSSITEHVRAASMPRAKRLRLVQQVCRAVHYAHQRLVIHRDLKPANVLVRADGAPVLLDFGIAKLLDANASGQHQTQTGMPWFTPAYASPEQRTGQPVSTATDIYSLGALLFELITDEVPRPDAEGRIAEPSTRRTRDGVRGGDRELDIIVGKATHPEPDRRYASAEALANDIERYLRGRPIQAAPDSVGYRMAKFVRRHAWATAAMLVLVALAGVFVWRLAAENERAWRAEQLAQRESAAATRVVDYLVGLFDAASPEKAGARPISPAELVDLGVRDLAEQLDEQPMARARLYTALGEIYAKIGQTEKGIATIERAIELQRGSGDEIALARSLALYGNMLNTSNRFGQAVEVLDEGIALQEQRGDADPAVMAEMLTSVSLARGRIGQLVAAISDAERALAAAAKAGDKASMLRGEANNALSEAYLRNGDNARAIEIARRNVAELEATGPESTLLSARTYLAAVLAEEGLFGEAETLLRGVLAQRLRTLDTGSDWVISLRNQLAMVLRNDGRPVEAVAMLRENVEAMKARGETNTPTYSVALNNLGSFGEHIGDLAFAEPLMREALALAEAETDPTSSRPDIYRQNLGRVLMLQGEYREALALIEREIVDDGSEDRRIARLRRLVGLAEWNRLNRRHETAASFLDQAQANLVANFGAEHPRGATIIRARALLERDLGHLPESEALLRRALAVIEPSAGQESNPVTELRLDLADVLVRRDQRDEARALVERVHANVYAKFMLDSAPCVLFERLAATLGIKTALQEQRKAA